MSCAVLMSCEALENAIGRGAATCSFLSHSLLSRNLRVICIFPRSRSCRCKAHVGGAERVRRRCCLLLERSICGALDLGGCSVSVLVWRDLPHALLLILEERRPRVECSLGWQGGGRLALRTNGKGSTISTLGGLQGYHHAPRT